MVSNIILVIEIIERYQLWSLTVIQFYVTVPFSLFIDDHLDDSNEGVEDRNLSKKDLEDIEADSNENLALIGNNIIGDTLKAFVRIALPNIPEEGVEAIKSYLTSDEMLSRISFHIGTKDLILSKEYPPSRETYANVFKAIVGALSLRYVLLINIQNI